MKQVTIKELMFILEKAGDDHTQLTSVTIVANNASRTPIGVLLTGAQFSEFSDSKLSFDAWHPEP